MQVPTCVVFPSANWWPANLGVPSAVGGQNTVRYAIFPIPGGSRSIIRVPASIVSSPFLIALPLRRRLAR